MSARADELYVIQIDTPSNGATLALNTGYTVSGSVDWPFYREDIERVYISTWKNGVKASYQSQCITGSTSSSCTLSTGANPVAIFTSPGTYEIKVQAQIYNGTDYVTLNEKTILVYAQ